MGYIVPVISSVIIQYSFPFLDGVDFFEPVIKIVRNCKRVYSLLYKEKNRWGKFLCRQEHLRGKLSLGCEEK